jgi:GNAT superfamily N-acetyltransferase
MTARRALPDDWERVKELRLRALREEPNAFHSRYEDEVEETDEEWRDWLGRTAVFVAGDYEAICGAYVREDGCAQLIAMYVLPDARGRGLGRALVAAVEDWARREGHPRVFLNVMDGNDAARALYESCGYRSTGVRRSDDPRSLEHAKTL